MAVRVTCHRDGIAFLIAAGTVAIGFAGCASACASTSRGAAAESPISVAVVDPIALQWEPPTVVAEGIHSDWLEVPIDADIASDGRIAVVWTQGRREDYDVLVAERGPEATDAWRDTRVAHSEEWSRPVPRVRFDPQGGLIVAWELRYGISVPNCWYSTRSPEEPGFSSPRPLHGRSAGAVALDVDAEGVHVAYVKAVRKFNQRKLFGDFVHDPPSDDYGKMFVGTLAEDSICDRLALDGAGDLEAEQPSLRGRHLVFFREGSHGGVEPRYDLVYAELGESGENTDLEEIARAPDSDLQEEHAAIAIRDGRPVVAYDARERGVVVRERTAAGWSPPELVLPRAQRCSLACVDGTLYLAAFDDASDAMVCARRSHARWESFSGPGRGEVALVLASGATPMLFWSTGRPGRGTLETRAPERLSHTILMTSLRGATMSRPVRP